MTAPGDDPDAYAELRRRRPDLFANPPGAAVRILPSSPAEGGPYGVCYRDPYITVLRDPVAFRGGATGGYVRIVPSSGSAGAAILPVCGDKVVLVRHFRHSTRRWHWEIPRGFGEPGESTERTARRELREEIGAEALELKPLGDMHADTGLTGGRAGLFWARVGPPAKTADDEGIDAVVLFTVRELDELLASGELTDSFTMAAILGARIRGLAPFTAAE